MVHTIWIIEAKLRKRRRIPRKIIFISVNDLLNKDRYDATSIRFRDMHFFLIALFHNDTVTMAIMRISTLEIQNYIKSR